ncbi:stress-responsive transcription factor hsf1 [Haplosporangium sp. Z 767]|nr:stress-responsive transcription factor hsf1 [Haplosporangium sp. Z 767]
MFIDPNNHSSNNGDNRNNTSNSKIVELPSSSPRSVTLNNSTIGTTLTSNENTERSSEPIVTTPGSGSLSDMSSPGSNSGQSTAVMGPTSRSVLALMNAAQGLQQQQQQQQQAQNAGLPSDATLALLSNLGSNVSSTQASTKPSTTTGRGRGSSGRNNTANNTGTAASSSSQSLQPLSRQTNGAQKNVAAFLTKLYNMVKEPSSNSLIKWSDNGQSFIVANHVEFAKEVLPKFFKHNNFSSFVRQLNMYGFHKIPHLQQGVLMPDADSEQWEFSNPHFQRNQPDLLYLVSRKKASTGNEDKDALTMDLTHILQEVTAIKRHQIAISTDLKNIERDHQALWQESVAARERHQRQQETIDKILRFLASVFSGEKKRAIVPNKKPRLTITEADNLDDVVTGISSAADEGRRLLEEQDDEEEEDHEEIITLPAAASNKRKRGATEDSAEVANEVRPTATVAPLALLTNTNQNTKKSSAGKGNLPAVPTVNAATTTTSTSNFPEYLTSLPGLNYANLSNITSSLPGGFKFDPTNLTIPTALLPNTLSPVHHDMLRSISMANARDSSSTMNSAPPLAPLPPSLNQTPQDGTVTKGVDQITMEMEQLQRSIEALQQHGLNVDNFDFDDDAYLPLTDSYDSTGYGDPGTTYTMDDNNNNYMGITGTTVLPPSSSNTGNTGSNSTSVGANPRISTVDEEEYLEDLLNLDPA